MGPLVSKIEESLVHSKNIKFHTLYLHAIALWLRSIQTAFVMKNKSYTTKWIQLFFKHRCNECRKHIRVASWFYRITENIHDFTGMAPVPLFHPRSCYCLFPLNVLLQLLSHPYQWDNPGAIFDCFLNSSSLLSTLCWWNSKYQAPFVSEVSKIFPFLSSVTILLLTTIICHLDNINHSLSSTIHP